MPENTTEHEPVTWRWVILLAFSLNCAMNSFMFMDFTACPGPAKDLLKLCDSDDWDCDSGDGPIGWTYSSSLLAVLPTAFPAVYFLSRRNWLTTGFGVSCNCIGAALRYVAAVQRSYTIGVISSIPIGCAAAVVMISYSQISCRWFPVHERTLATSMAVQSNYTGWLIGALLIPYMVQTRQDLEILLRYQAIMMGAVFVAFLLFHREGPPKHESAQPREEDGADESLRASLDPEPAHEELSILELGKLLLEPQFCLQCLCFATLAGVSFAVPGFQTTVLSNMDLSDRQAAWTNFSFIFSGVCTGLFCGGRFKPEQFPAALKVFFCVASAALLGLTVLGWVQDSLSFSTSYVLAIVMMAFAGGSTLGFIGIALAAINQTAHKAVHAEYSGGAVEWWLQVVGAILTQVADACQSQAFLICGVLVWITTAVMMTLYKQPFNKLEQQTSTEPCVEGTSKEPLVTEGDTSRGGEKLA